MRLICFILSALLIGKTITLDDLWVKRIEMENNQTENVIEAQEEDGNKIYLGEWVTTGYCNCSQCCGKWAGGNTASGVMPTAGRTVASDLPFGTVLLINGMQYVVEDRGVSGQWADIYFNSHEEALNYGMQTVSVYQIVEG